MKQINGAHNHPVVQADSWFSQGVDATEQLEEMGVEEAVAELHYLEALLQQEGTMLSQRHRRIVEPVLNRQNVECR